MEGFLKPTKIKIVILLLFAVIPFIFEEVLLYNGCLSPTGTPQSEVYISQKCLTNGILKNMNSYVLISWMFGFPAVALSMPFSYLPDNIFIPISLIIFLVYWYVFSSIFVFAYDKLKKK